MFKIKPTKKTTTTLTSIINGQHGASQKQRMQLQQNNDFLNLGRDSQLSQRDQQERTMQNGTKDNMKRKGSLVRPGSGFNRNLMKTSIIGKNDNLSDEQLIQQKIKQKAMERLRPSTSSNLNENTAQLKQKKHRLMNRKGTLNANNSHSINIPKPNKILSNPNIQSLGKVQTAFSDNNVYVSNEEVLEMMGNILESQEYVRLKHVNEDQFERIIQKLRSNVSIMVLKWCKVVQDRLYMEVKTITSPSQHNPTPQTINQLIESQIQRQFIKYRDLFRIQQQCSSRESRLQELIDGRLSKLQRLLCDKQAVSFVEVMN